MGFNRRESVFQNNSGKTVHLFHGNLELSSRQPTEITGSFFRPARRARQPPTVISQAPYFYKSFRHKALRLLSACRHMALARTLHSDGRGDNSQSSSDSRRRRNPVMRTGASRQRPAFGASVGIHEGWSLDNQFKKPSNCMKLWNDRSFASDVPTWPDFVYKLF